MTLEDKATVILNNSFVRPAKFFLTGLSNFPHIKYFSVFLCFMYLMTVFGNVFLMSVICYVKNLHTPKYMIVFNMAFTDLCASSVFLPKLLDTFLFNRRYIFYEACITYMFFVYYFGSVHSYTLVIMAFDRFIAICFPLRYHAIVTKTSIAVMLLIAWLFLPGFLMYAAALIDRLSFCRSQVIESFHCDHGPLRLLACNDTSANVRMVFLFVFAILIVPFSLIVASYVCILIALSRIASVEERLRALKTCSSHLIMVAITFLPILATNIASLATYIHPQARMINSILTHAVPHLFNPIIYFLKTEEVLTAIKTLCKRVQ
ncbi:unnamed protein product [Ophioblennius macclurei]